MGGYSRLICVAVWIPVALAIVSPVLASGVASRPGRALEAEVARAAIAQAERVVRRASAQGMLWTTAEESLRAARRAFSDGNLALAVAQARVAKEHAELAVAQKRYPLYRI